MGRSIVIAGLDAWADSTRPAMNLSQQKTMAVRGANGTPTAYSYIWFKNPAPARAVITRAVLRLYTNGAWGTGNTTCSVQRIWRPSNAPANWTLKFGQLNWNNRPPTQGGIVTVTQPSPVGRTLWEFNVQPQIQHITNGNAWYGFRISSPSTTRRDFWTLDNGFAQPRLEVEWSDHPQRPTSLVPSGNQVVSLQRPVLDFSYIDVGGNTDLAAVHVQISPTANWTNPGWDSGRVAQSSTPFDTETTPSTGAGGTAAGNIWTGIATQGESRFWRVRVQDGAGLWSPWSAQQNGVGARWTRRNKGTVTLTNPGTAGVVYDLTPPISWTFSGTQTAFQIIVAEASDTTKWLWNSGRVNGTETSRTVPRNVLTQWGKRYHVRVRVWDQYDRVATVGDPAFAVGQREFTTASSASVLPVSNLTGFSDPNRVPGVTLNWTRIDTPDFYNILRNGRAIAQNIPGPNLHQGGQNYRYIDRAAANNTAHTWQVQAVVNGTISSNNPTYRGEVRSPHAWLVDRDVGTRAVPLLDPEISFEAPEVAGTYEPIMRDRVVRVPQSQRGLEGTCNAVIAQFTNVTVKEWESNLYWMKRRPARIFRFLVGDKSWRVMLGDITVSPTRTPGDQIMAVSFTFWTMDGVPEP